MNPQCYELLKSLSWHNRRVKNGIPNKWINVWRDEYKKEKIKYFLLETPFPQNTDPWENQAIQREYLLNCTDFADKEDYIFFSDPDEIPKPEILKKFELKKKYGIFLQECFNYKFNFILMGNCAYCCQSNELIDNDDDVFSLMISSRTIRKDIDS